MMDRMAHLYCVIVQWIYSFDSKADANEYEDGPISPLHPTMSVSSDRIHRGPGSSVDVRFVEGAIRSYSNAEARVGEVVNESPMGNVSDGCNAHIDCARGDGVRT